FGALVSRRVVARGDHRARRARIGDALRSCRRVGADPDLRARRAAPRRVAFRDPPDAPGKMNTLGQRAWRVGMGLCVFLLLGPIPRRCALGVMDAQYYCPTHHDQRADVPAPCGVCGMRMVKMPPARFDTYPVDLRATATTGGARLRLVVRDPRTRATVRRFTI